MTISEVDWRSLTTLSGDDLKRQVFLILRDAALELQSSDSNTSALLEAVPRLADIIPYRPELASFKEAFSALARSTGLWNYIDKETADTADAILAEAVTAPELDGVTLHREQIAALNDLLGGKNLILSAPTSFGKSLLVDALLATRRYKRVAIVLPTIALLDEFRRRLIRRFQRSFSIVMHHSEEAGDGPTIFLGTQERLINRSDLGTLDLTVVDEFYKLDPSRKDERSLTLNAAVYRLLSRSRQFFFLGPNIDNVRVAGDGRWKFEFLRTRFATVAVDTYDLTSTANKEDRLYEEMAEDTNWPALVFVSSPDRANRLAAEARTRMAVSDDGAAFADWIREYIGPRWPLAEQVEWGFAVHHGRIPRAMASHMVRLFNDSTLPVMFCTSTLIEGVNTAAKTVMIYDKAINRSDYDFFTFSNIKGRAGRLGQHHVGKVFLFNEPPAPAEMEVAPTLFASEEETPDDYLVHLEPEDASPAVDDRMAALKEALGLDAEGLRLAATVGLDNALALKQVVRLELRESSALSWKGYPSWNTLLNLCRVLCATRRASEFGAFTAKQLAFFISSLRSAKTMQAFFLRYNGSFIGDDDAFDNVFKFLRACEYGLPQNFAVIELFVRESFPDTDYSLFLRELARWFRNEELKNLDEEGIPIQISERFAAHGDGRDLIVQRLVTAVREKSSALSPFERDWVAAALDLPSS